MSLISALRIATGGLLQSQQQMTVTSQNITNADKAGYTQKVYNSGYSTTNGVTVPTDGTISGTVNKYLDQAVNEQASKSANASVISDYLSDYSSDLGTTDDSASSISGQMDTLIANLSTLSAAPQNNSAKTAIVSGAQSLAIGLNQASQGVQALRGQADGEIGSTVIAINANLDALDKLNDQITAAHASNQSTANLEDDRSTALNDLAGKIGVQYYVNSDNRLQIYTQGGATLLDSSAHPLSYTPTSNVSSSTSYPGGFSALTLNGHDVTNGVTGGKLGGLLALRDRTLPAEQDKLDTLATTLSSTVNGVLNSGASYTPRNTLTGDTGGLTLADPITATGTVRVAVTDASGTVQSYSDVDLSTIGSVGDVVGALGGLAGVTASLNASGELVVSSTNPAYGISLNQASSDLGGGKGFASYFGLNNMFAGTNGAAVNASNIQVSSYLTGNPSYLTSGTLSASASLAVGSRGVSEADGSSIDKLITAFSSASSFTAAGDFAAQNTTLGDYAANIISTAASKASTASTTADTASSTLGYVTDKKTNYEGVNIDQETAFMTQVQNMYESNAQMISTVQQMFKSLLSAVG